MVQLVVVGGGKMGEALVGGLVAAGWAPPGAVLVVEPVADRRAELERHHEGLLVVESVAAAEERAPGADVLVAVKPNHVRDVCTALAEVPGRRLLSIAAGVTTTSIESWLGTGARVVRSMPNTPSLIGAGMAAICAGAAATPDDLDWASDIMGSVGQVVVATEPLMDAVTGVSGSGPAYVFALAEALVAAGVAVGLDPITADTLTRQTLLGAARLLAESGEDPAVLRANVTSPGGTTAAGLAVFAERGLPDIVAEVVAAATRRSRELGSA